MLLELGGHGELALLQAPSSSLTGWKCSPRNNPLQTPLFAHPRLCARPPLGTAHDPKGDQDPAQDCRYPYRRDRDREHPLVCPSSPHSRLTLSAATSLRSALSRRTTSARSARPAPSDPSQVESRRCPMLYHHPPSTGPVGFKRQTEASSPLELYPRPCHPRKFKIHSTLIPEIVILCNMSLALQIKRVFDRRGGAARRESFVAFNFFSRSSRS